MLQLRENSDEVDVAKARNQERDAEKHHAEFEAHRQEDIQLRFGKILIAYVNLAVGEAVRGVVAFSGNRSVFWANEGYNKHNAELGDGKNPEEDAGSHGIHRSPLQSVPNGESHTQVALYADSREEEGAVVDGHVEDKSRQRTQGVGHIPDHAIHRFLHLEGQEEEKEEVRNGQVEEQDVDRCRLLHHFLTESVEGQDVGREAQHECNDVDGETKFLAPHGGLWCESPKSVKD